MMKKSVCCIATCIALVVGGTVDASRPSMSECLEGSDFIGDAALSRDGGMPEEAFIDRMKQDLLLIRSFPPELRWFAHDPDDEIFLLHEARKVFDHPEPAADHRRAFLSDCVERMAAPQIDNSKSVPTADST